MIPLKDNIPTLRFPIVTVALIVINIAVFLGFQLQASGDPGSAKSADLARQGISERDVQTIEYGAIPYRITHPGEDCGVSSRARVVCEDQRAYEDSTPLTEAAWWLTILTSMFMHGGLLHIGGNMLFLWVFGNNIEDSMGRARFVLFYLLAGAVAVYAQALLDPEATVPTIGASGAVAGVLGAYLLLHPRARVLSLVIIIFFVTFIEIPAMLLLGIWFLLQFLPAVGQLGAVDGLDGGGIAYLAHVGGFIFGLLAIKLFTAGRRGESGPRPSFGRG